MAKKIQDNNLLYNILRPLVQFATRCHYNHFVVRGLENLPDDGSYIIAPCHQQALMEPLAVLYFSHKPPVFLARADIFAKPVQRAILTFLRIMPVYRIRDGKSNLGKNHAVFDQSRDVLLDGYPLCLMAEGRHNNRHRLLPLGKGMFRIAGETQLRLGDHPLYIVPTGIDFDDYERPYSNVVVNIGKPIPVQPFMDTYRADEPVALNQMREALTEALLPLMHDIRDEEHYDQIVTLGNVLNREMRRGEGLRNNAWNRFRMRQKISVTAHDAESLALAGTLHEQCRKLHLDERMLSDHWNLAVTLFAVVLLGAVAAAAVMVPTVRWALLFCLVCYPIPFIPTHLIVKKMVADPQFRSSFNFGVRLVLSIVYAVVAGIVVACLHGVWWGLAAVAWVHVGARLAALEVNFLRDTYANCRYWLLRMCRCMREVDKTYNALVVLKKVFL